MNSIEQSNKLYPEIFEKLNKLLYLGAFTEYEINDLCMYLRDDINHQPERWSNDKSHADVSGVLVHGNKEQAFHVFIDVLSILSKIVDYGCIDQYDYPSVVNALCRSIERNELPLSCDSDEYIEYFNNNSPVVEDASSY